MTQGREAILGRIRGALGNQAATRSAGLGVDRVSASKPLVQPGVEGPLLLKFCEKHTAVHGTYERVPDRTQVPAAVLRHLKAYEIAPEFWSARGVYWMRLAGRPIWPPSAGLRRLRTRGAVSEALPGVAETGTLVLLSGEGRPTSHLFLRMTISFFWTRAGSPGTRKRSGPSARNAGGFPPGGEPDYRSLEDSGRRADSAVRCARSEASPRRHR
ncbi:MAG: hypothetical protein CM1200mP20_16920 [Pseudomonadota bacterium]|nr:MAG: hypothetical protein CM1200mP20_16920 [Pseudomonadota bacterium]